MYVGMWDASIGWPSVVVPKFAQTCRNQQPGRFLTSLEPF